MAAGRICTSFHEAMGRTFHCTLPAGHSGVHESKEGDKFSAWQWVSESSASKPIEEMTPLELMVSWWNSVAAEDAERTVPKAIEYGSSDLNVMAAAIQPLLTKVRGSEVSVQECVEFVCAFYLLGKVARMFGAYVVGRSPSDDTVFDARIYSMMMQRVRDTGSWV